MNYGLRMMASGAAWSSPIAVYVQRRGQVIHSKANRYAYAFGWPVSEVRIGENSRLETHTHGPDLSGAIGGAGGIGGILSVAHTGESEPWRYYHADGNGNIVLLTDKDEEETARIEYDPFGRVLINTASQPVRYQFSSKEVDEATGLNYYGYRFYAPELGRWINRDPIGENIKKLDRKGK